jgi:hypothetical protein
LLAPLAAVYHFRNMAFLGAWQTSKRLALRLGISPRAF